MDWYGEGAKYGQISGVLKKLLPDLAGGSQVIFSGKKENKSAAQEKVKKPSFFLIVPLITHCHPKKGWIIVGQKWMEWIA